MKKICLVAGILSLSSIGFGQQKSFIKEKDKDTIVTVITTPIKATDNTKVETGNLKTSHIYMQKHFSETQTSLPAIDKKKKLVVNRVGSKQLTWSKE